eukprot:jgi/Chlat1/6681/Chrsp49S06167
MVLIQYMPQLAKKRIVLASASPRRQEILRGLGLPIEVIKSTFEETLAKSAYKNGGDYAVETATHKAIDVASRTLASSRDRPPDLIIAADTVVEYEGLYLEKPADEVEAVQMLTRLSGSRHVVHTGVALMLPAAADPKVGKPPLLQTFYESTEVQFAPLDAATIRAYVASKEPMDKAGCYGIQGVGGSFVKSINGCYFNVVGFPTHRFCVELEKLIKAGHLSLSEPAPLQ